MIFFQIFTKYSTHHSLSANTGFKSLAVILFEILHLQNCGRISKFQRAIMPNELLSELNFYKSVVMYFMISWSTKDKAIFMAKTDFL